MRNFSEANVLTTKPRFNVKRTYRVNARLGGDGNSRRENPHNCYDVLTIYNNLQ